MDVYTCTFMKSDEDYFYFVAGIPRAAAEERDSTHIQKLRFVIVRTADTVREFEKVVWDEDAGYYVPYVEE